MTIPRNAAVLMASCLVSCLLAALLGAGCNGRKESGLALDGASTAPRQQQPIDARQALGSINDAIPVYSGAHDRDDLTRRDEILIHDRYGAGAEVYTLATDDSFPQVYHYYTTYLAQFRAFPSQDTFPPESRDWRSLEVMLNEAMQDPFIPGEALDANGKQVTLQIVESETVPRTVIRYIVTPGPPRQPAIASNEAMVRPIAQ
jgi:hypothetical protein